MNILIDLLPEEVEIEGNRYAINSDFRVSILFEQLMQSEEFSNEDKCYMALNLYYEEVPSNVNLAVEEMLWFYKCGKEVEELNSGGEGGTGSSQNQIYCFDNDDDYIYSAFLDQYGIDLQDIEYLHWWKFKAMFKSLKEDNKISKIMGYRAMTISDDMSNSEKKHYRELKRLYSLPDNRTTEEKEEDFYNSLSDML